jgi:multimeric flavodoxin WrbA
MRIAYLNGNPDILNSKFEDKTREIIRELETTNNVDHYILRDIKIKPCTGCFSCWVKNPGECIFDDDSAKIRKTIMDSDLILFSSPIIMGFTSALLKHAQDKMIPNLMPYIEFVNKECHHQARYEKYPNIGLLYQNMDDTESEDIDIIKQIYERFSLNFRGEFVLFENIEKNPEEIIHALNIN